MELKRLSGILVHPTSFPSKHGIGDLGQSAYDFIDFLYESKQGLWQVLPLGPTSFGDSPYQSFSTFAGNTLLISPELLVSEGYLKESELGEFACEDEAVVSFGKVIEYKNTLHKKAFASFKLNKTKKQSAAFESFCKDNAAWLDDFVMFVALKYHFINERTNTFESPEYKAYKKLNQDLLDDDMINDCFYGAVWSSWPSDILNRKSDAMLTYGKLLDDEISYLKFLQYEFFRQWLLLREYANSHNIKIIGDIPIFVALDSSDVWANRENFYLDEKGYPTIVAGVPPDYFSETGQLWGNPIYNWAKHKKDGYTWWIKRIESCLTLVDILRIDHFRGFDEYWAVKYGEKTAMNGEWQKGPGKELFYAIKKALGELPIIAEDLGLITEQVIELRDDLKLPGMKVLQFAFDGTGLNEYLPHNFDTSHAVIYTGTHDNDTSIGWYEKESDVVKDYFRRYLNVSGDNAAWDMVRLAFVSSARYAIVPIQDVLGLGSEARMNTPGVASGNWQFRYKQGDLSENISETLAYFAKLFNRAAEELEVVEESFKSENLEQEI